MFLCVLFSLWAAQGGLGRLGTAWAVSARPGSCLSVPIALAFFSVLFVVFRPIGSLCIAFRLSSCYFVFSAFFVLFVGLGASRAALLSPAAPIFSAFDRISFVDLDRRSIGLRTFDRSFNIRLVSMIHSSIFERSIGFGSSFRAQLDST